MTKIQNKENFTERHIGPRADDINQMLEVIKLSNLDELIKQTIPANIRFKEYLEEDNSISEYEYLNFIKKIAAKNKIHKNYIGLGYYPSITPSVLQRNILENPGWYTQYTPYQAEISQGRLEALINFQTMVSEMTALPISNASLLDEATAAAEAMIMCKALRKGEKIKSNKLFVSSDCFPQTIEVIKTRANPLDIKVIIGNYNDIDLSDDIFAVLVQYPSSEGEIIDYSEFFKRAKEKNIMVIVAADILSLALLTPPGELGADIVVGSTQRFGIPVFYGGPHAGYFATREEYKRQIPGRLIGVTIDAHNNIAYRMALQTREQHIKREKATSNICTAQVLLAIISGMYAIYHGHNGIKNIALRIHKLTKTLNHYFKILGYNQINNHFFDTLKIVFNAVDKSKINSIRTNAELQRINFRYTDNAIGISLNERTTMTELSEIINLFSTDKVISIDEIQKIYSESDIEYPEILIRKSDYLTNTVFSKYHSETDMMRYIKSLENKDLSLTGSMIPLGSCTMKLNAATEMMPVSWPEFSEIHPFVPVEQAEGYRILIEDLGKYLCEITGFDGISFQPNSGAQGEYTGLMVIRAYHKNRGEEHRNIVLIPCSAHGTNPASAVMAGMKVVIVNCDENGNIDFEDLKKNAELYKYNLAGIMVTYPSTHGVFEEEIVEICKLIHNCGGQVYLDGANMNAQVGLTSPAKIGADVCHLNLHKTFCIPHGGGGPGVGPIAVAKHLTEFLPGHSLADIGTPNSITAVSAAPFGSAGILMIPYAYILMMGFKGLTFATKIAILNANYVKERLSGYYKVLYTGKNNRVAHELIFDVREFKHTAKIEVVDIAKRLMDYGFHAPTVSFPVPGTLMFEPTESESKEELDRFCDAMISIREEIASIENGSISDSDNPLKNSPHTSYAITSEEWNHPYTRHIAAFPTVYQKLNKFWPSVGRINDAYGDRNLVCTCPSLEEYKNENT